MSSIVLRKSGGFYVVFGDDSIIFYYLFKYKIVGDRVGFPIKSIDKVLNKLNECKINYKIINTDINVNFKLKNNYNKYLDLGKKKYSLDYRINSIIDKLELLDEKDIDKIISFIEGVYEWEIFSS